MAAGKEMVLFITHVEGPTCFWGQDTNQDEIDITNILSTELNTTMNSENSAATLPLDGERLYAAQFSDDNMWYRCKVHKFLDNGKVDVTFCDYGNREIKQASELKQLPSAYQNVAPRALRLFLNNTRPDAEKSYAESQQYLKNLIENKLCRVTKIPTNGPMEMADVFLFEDETNVNEKIVADGYAVNRGQDMKGRGGGSGARPQLSSNHFGGSGDAGNSADLRITVHEANGPQSNYAGPQGNYAGPQGNYAGPQGSHDRTSGQLNQRPQPGYGGQDRGNQRGGNRGAPRGGRGRGGNRGGGGGYSSGAPPNQQFVPPPLMHDTAGFGDGQQMRPTAKEQSLKEEIRKLQLNLEKREKCIKDLQEEIKANDNLAAKCQRLEAAVESAMTAQTSLQHNPLLTNLFGGVHRVKKLRTLLPSDGEDICQVAFNLLTSSNKVTMEMPAVTKVKETREQYEEIQNKIRDCTDKDELLDLTPKRDQLRRDLYENITALSTELEAMPIATRLKDLNHCIKTLKQTFDGQVNLEVKSDVTLEEALVIYCQWKDKKLAEFGLYRQQTNKCMEEFHASIKIILQLTSLMSKADNKVAVGLDFDFEDKLSCVSQAVAQESKHTDVTETEQQPDSEITMESMLLAMVVSLLLRALEQEIKVVGELQSFHMDMEKLKVSFATWLNQKPELSGVNAAREAVKNQRSKLRHALADYQDLEEQETGSENSKELAAKKTEIKEIREDLQKAFKREETAMEDLLEIVQQHFPELLQEHRDLSPDFLASRGLLKQGRSLDHYETLQQDSTKIIKSTYCGFPIAIKELVTPLNQEKGRQAILKNAQPFWKSQCPYLISVHAVFWSNRHSYLIMDWYDDNLYKLVIKHKKIPAQVLLQLARDVCSSLAFLHKQHISHGRIHPANIFWHQGHAVLADFDFAKQRLECYRSTNNMTFCAPEFLHNTKSMNSDSVCTEANDMYCLGLVIVWLLDPLVTPSMSVRGVPVVSDLKTHPNIKVLLDLTLKFEATKRSTAQQILEKDIWSIDDEEAVDVTPVTETKPSSDQPDVAALAAEASQVKDPNEILIVLD